MLMAQDEQHHLIAAAEAQRQTTYHCPGCQAPVRLKHGTVMVAHFAHQSVQDCHTFSEGETAEHLQGKQQLASWFKASGYTVQLEAPLPAIHQRPDVLVQLGQNRPLALEFQCSPLSVERLAERTQGYRNHGYRVLWLLGSPYQRVLRTNAKALKFLHYNQQWGCYLAFWQVNLNGLLLVLNIATYDGEPLTYQRQLVLAKTTSVLGLLAYQPVLVAPMQVATRYQTYQQRLTLGRLTHQAAAVKLQKICYTQGGTLSQLPAWVVPVSAKPPILRTTYLVWYLQLFIQLRQQPLVLRMVQLTTVIWTTLQPLLALRSCLPTKNDLARQLIIAVVHELKQAKVIEPVGADWRLNPAQLKWQPHEK
ncbi:competence protein [Lactobacillus sp. CBA3606]|uniref:competence protein CoiA n=1 Tax=Lactobacillus sp. CBA3606 TaxID=2099789 RepID=UPI000CFC9F27|nr:competence protein CoiA family protein [Lactobacillus sp. CBA3606]AVK63287.1 competence protein [Lactobacillus sp. CBA3606]